MVVRLYVIWYTHHATGAEDSHVLAKVVALAPAVWLRLLLTLLRQVQDRLGGVQENNLSLVAVISSDHTVAQLLSDFASIGADGVVLLIPSLLVASSYTLFHITILPLVA